MRPLSAIQKFKVENVLITLSEDGSDEIGVALGETGNIHAVQSLEVNGGANDGNVLLRILPYRSASTLDNSSDVLCGGTIIRLFHKECEVRRGWV